MITILPYERLGHANHGWLDARHHFSFANYHDPERMNFGVLRVVNDDVILAGAGFDMHPHRNMEIITYVRSGAISHKDSNGNAGRTVAGDVQVMSAGSGIFHSEYNLESVDTNIYQIWIEPNRSGVEPRWDSHAFPKSPVEDELQLLVSGDGKAPLQIYQDARIYAGRLNAGAIVDHRIVQQAYVLISDGRVSLDGQDAKKGDGAEVRGQGTVTIKALEDAEILVIDVGEG